MPRANIRFDMPKSDLELLKKWSNYPEEQKKIIFEALEGIKPTLDLDTLKSKFAEQSKLGKLEAELIFQSVVTLYCTYYNFSVPLDEFIETLLGLFEDDKELKLEADAKSRISEIIKKIFKMDKSLGIISKTLILIDDYPSIFLNSRIITDLRPIFPQDIEEEPTNTIVVHNLKLIYHDSYEIKELYISMFHKDLIKMEEIIKRAKSKEKTLRKFCQEKIINILGDNDEPQP